MSRADQNRWPQVFLGIRVFRDGALDLGPDNVALLKAIRETGSIRQAAMQLKISYMHAWLLVRTMNHCFQDPVLRSTRGGRHHGGATLTPTGIAVISLYEQLESESLAATRETRRELARLLKSPAS